MAEKKLGAAVMHCLVVALDKIPASPKVSVLRPHSDLFKELMSRNKEYADRLEAFIADREKSVLAWDAGHQESKDLPPESKKPLIDADLEKEFGELVKALNESGKAEVAFELGDAERAFVDANWKTVFGLLPPNCGRSGILEIMTAFDVKDVEEEPAA